MHGAMYGAMPRKLESSCGRHGLHLEYNRIGAETFERLVPIALNSPGEKRSARGEECAHESGAARGEGTDLLQRGCEELCGIQSVDANRRAAAVEPVTLVGDCKQLMPVRLERLPVMRPDRWQPLHQCKLSPLATPLATPLPAPLPPGGRVR